MTRLMRGLREQPSRTRGRPPTSNTLSHPSYNTQLAAPSPSPPSTGKIRYILKAAHSSPSLVWLVEFPFSGQIILNSELIPAIENTR